MLSLIRCAAFGKVSAAGICLTTLFAQPPSLSAEEKATLVLTVDQSQDSSNGSCESGVSGQCNLRAAIATVLAAGGKANVKLSVDSKIETGEIVISPTNPDLAPIDLKISGQRGERRIDGTAMSRLVSIGAGVTVAIHDARISGFQAYNAGVISNAGSLTLARTVIEDNKASCFGNGAMTAYASCFAGAIENTGRLLLKNGTKFVNNSVTATASTASFTNAIAGGGAIVSSGSLVFDGKILFQGNMANAQAHSGYHGQMPGGASASASGGAISNSGEIIITRAGQGKCRFIQNQAVASASTANGDASYSMRSGAVDTYDFTDFDLKSGCQYEGNTPDGDDEISTFPT